MIEGTLVINLDPAFVQFSYTEEGGQGDGMNFCSWKHCSLSEIRDLLIDLDAIAPSQAWPPRDCVLRLSLTVPKAALAKLGFGNVYRIDSLLHKSDQGLKLIS